MTDSFDWSEKFEKLWIEKNVAWIEFLRNEGRSLLDLPIPAVFLASRSHFFDLAEHGELHMQRFPEGRFDFNLSQWTQSEIDKLMAVLVALFGNEDLFHQMYLVRECKRLKK